MANEGTINGIRDGNQPYLRISWEILKQETTNNRSLVNLKLYLVSPSTINMWSGVSKRGSLYGSGFSYSDGFVGTGTRLINERNVWISHNSNGNRTVILDASFNIDITWESSPLETLSVSGDAILDGIARGSEINSAIFNHSLQPGADIDILLNLDRHDDRYRHNVQLRDGSYVVARWNNHNSDGDARFSLIDAEVNDLLARLKNVESKVLTVSVQTISEFNGSNIGRVQTMNILARIHDDVVPSASDLIISQDGNNVSDHYLQNISKIEASFTRSATGGATVARSMIVVRRADDLGDRQDINGPEGITRNPIQLTGGYEVLGIVTDSRGRTSRIRETFISTAYNPPEISNFSAGRLTGAPATIKVDARGSHTNLGRSNKLTIRIERRQGGGSWSLVDSEVVDDPVFEIDSQYTGNTVNSSLVYRIRATDSFGNHSESQNTIPAQKISLDIHKNEGVGIGGLHEVGELDVHGMANIRGQIYIVPQGGELPRLRIVSRDNNGHGYVEIYNQNNVRKAYMGIADSVDKDLSLGSYEGAINLRSGINQFKFNSEDIMTGGRNSNGTWLKLYDGTLVCSVHLASAGHGSRIELPADFIDTEYGISVIADTNNTVPGYNSSNLARDAFTLRLYNDNNTVTGRQIKVVAVGRWK